MQGSVKIVDSQGNAITSTVDLVEHAPAIAFVIPNVDDGYCGAGWSATYTLTAQVNTGYTCQDLDDFGARFGYFWIEVLHNNNTVALANQVAFDACDFISDSPVTKSKSGGFDFVNLDFLCDS